MLGAGHLPRKAACNGVCLCRLHESLGLLPTCDLAGELRWDCFGKVMLRAGSASPAPMSTVRSATMNGLCMKSSYSRGQSVLRVGHLLVHPIG